MTLGLYEIPSPTSDEFQWDAVSKRAVSKRLVRAHEVVGTFPAAQLAIDCGRRIGVGVHLIELFVMSAAGALLTLYRVSPIILNEHRTVDEHRLSTGSFILCMRSGSFFPWPKQLTDGQNGELLLID